MYKALYRKYRPKRFSDVAGQGHITETLRSQVMTDRLTHAYLLVGTRGTGKTTCAKILSRAINCINPADGNPCNECFSCIGIEDGSILDVLELDAASNSGVDDVRAMRDEAVFSPVSVKKRVYIVDEVHTLSKAAFNAMLKILEEPPEHIVFILATTELHKVPATIQSRCQKFLFKRLSREDIAARLNEIAASEGILLATEAALELAMLADGSMRDGISLLDQCASESTIDLTHVRNALGLAGKDELLGIVTAIANYNIISAFDILDELYDDGKDMIALLNELSGIFRDLLVVKIAPGSSLLSREVSQNELSEKSKLFTSERLFYCLDVLKNMLLNLKSSGISKLTLEICLIKMSDERFADDLTGLVARVARLESEYNGARGIMQPVESKPNRAEKPAPAIETKAKSETENDLNSVTKSETKKETGKEADRESVTASETESEAQGEADSSEDIMSGILRNISNPPLRALVSDNNRSRAIYNDGLLVIKVTNDFTADAVKRSLSDLEEAVCRTLGKGTVTRVEAEYSNEDNNRQMKLEDLKAFGDIVKVE